MELVTIKEKEKICTHSNSWYILYSILMCTVLIMKNIYLQTWSQDYKTFSCSTEHEIVTAHKTKILKNNAFSYFQTLRCCIKHANKCYSANIVDSLTIISMINYFMLS